jgi:hypothetical protein
MEQANFFFDLRMVLEFYHKPKSHLFHYRKVSDPTEAGKDPATGSEVRIRVHGVALYLDFQRCLREILASNQVQNVWLSLVRAL